MRSLLSTPLGPVVQTAEAVRICDGRTFSTIGDVVTSDMLGYGLLPKVAAVDHITNRDMPTPEVEGGRFARTVTLDNPQGRIAKGAWKSVKDAYARTGSTLLAVNGEEDLLSIPAIILSPDGALVLFGVPDRGIGVNEASPENKLKCIEILASMEEC